MTRNRILFAVLLVAGLSLLFLATNCGPKQLSAEEFYKTATVDVTIPWAAGGNTDVIGRAYASKLHDYTGGTYVCYNRAGGASLEGAMWVKNAEPDGRTLMVQPSSSHILNWILKPDIGYTLDDYVAMGASAPQRLVFWVAPNSPFKTIADIQKAKGLLIGTTQATSNYTAGALTAIVALGLDAKYVTGYAGGSPLGLATVQNEIQASAQSIGGGLILQQQGMARALFVFGNTRDPSLPDVPALGELVKLEGDAKTMNELWDNMQTYLGVFTRADAPPDRVKYLSDIIQNKIHADPEFRTMTDKALSFKQGAFMSAADVKKSIDFFKTQAPQLRTLLEGAMKKYAK